MRSPPAWSITRAYWYSVSVSWMTLPSPEALTVPIGSASSAATPSGTSAQRRPRPSVATTASASAKTRNVRCVPTSGISSSADRNVPSSEPTVEIAYIRPAVSPESSICSSLSRIAHGETAPSISTGIATSASTPSSEPKPAPKDTSSKASTLSDRNGWATIGTSPSSTLATSTSRHSERMSGRRSAIRPPNQ